MLSFLKRHAYAIVFTVLALAILYLEYKAAPVQYRAFPNSFMNPFFVATGKWGIRFLLISLAMTPLYTVTGWRFLNKIRKPTGLVAFFFVAIHAGTHVFYRDQFSDLNTLYLFERLTQPWFILLGVGAYIILALLTITSIKPTMRMMGRSWKPLHRLVYIAAILILFHSGVAATSGKRAFMGGPESFNELKIYGAVLIMLLLARIPIVRDVLKDVSPLVPGRKSKRKNTSIAMETGD